MSYLRERPQLVRVDMTMCSCKPIHFGVPQCSVLGPILFLLFVNNIVSLYISGEIFLFADDISLMWSNPHLTALHRTLYKEFVIQLFKMELSHWHWDQIPRSSFNFRNSVVCFLWVASPIYDTFFWRTSVTQFERVFLGFKIEMFNISFDEKNSLSGFLLKNVKY